MKKDIRVIKKRKNLWNIFGWVFKTESSLSKNHSLNCGCSMCRMKTFYNRLENKQERLDNRNKLRSDIKNLDNE